MLISEIVSIPVEKLVLEEVNRKLLRNTKTRTLKLNWNLNIIPKSSIVQVLNNKMGLDDFLQETYLTYNMPKWNLITKLVITHTFSSAALRKIFRSTPNTTNLSLNCYLLKPISIVDVLMSLQLERLKLHDVVAHEGWDDCFSKLKYKNIKQFNLQGGVNFTQIAIFLESHKTITSLKLDINFTYYTTSNPWPLLEELSLKALFFSTINLTFSRELILMI